MNRLLPLLPLLLLATPAVAAPTQAPLPPPLPTPQDKPFPGQIELAVDATNIAQHIIQVAETIPVPPDGQLTLLYPKWLPGNHGPTGPLSSLAGLTVIAGGNPAPWQRDAVDMGAFHITVPRSAHAVQVRFQFLSPLDNKDARVVMTANMVEVEWRPEVLFPAGYFQRDIPVHASVRLPAGFQYATALSPDPKAGDPEAGATGAGAAETGTPYPRGPKPSGHEPDDKEAGSRKAGGNEADRQEAAHPRAGDQAATKQEAAEQEPEAPSPSQTVSFKTVPLETLLDSPVLAGRYFSRIDLDPGAPVPVHMDVVADRPKDLAIKPEDLQAHRNLVLQATRTFGGHHYDHYDFLFSVSEEMGGIGLEHQRSCEVGSGEDYFTSPAKSAPSRDLLPHEFTHSWNGKFRRPADLWSPDEHTIPEQTSLIWIYEGQTTYWGKVLAARSGILDAAQVRDQIALDAAEEDAATPGRAWRNLQDTTDDPIISWHKPSRWSSWSRFGDYYPEGALVWLDADTLIREKSAGHKSLDDFARMFFGVDDGDWTTHTYTFNDVVRALNQIQPYDWTTFLRTRLDGHGPGAPLDGLTRAGWKLTYTDTPSPMQKAADTARKATNLTFSLGLSLASDGTVRSVLWGSPAFRAGLAPGNKLAAVDGLALDAPDTLTDAVTAARTGSAPIELLVRDGARYRTIRIDYHGGLRYPHLERIAGTPDLFSDILAAVK